MTRDLVGLPAAASDIRIGDIIVEVESTDVTRANGDLVVSIVRKCPNTLQLILRRPMTSTSLTVSTASSGSLKPPVHPLSSRQPDVQSRSYGSSLRVRSMSSNAISLSQLDEMPFGMSSPPGMGVAQYSASQYLVPEMHNYRRSSAHFPPDFGLMQPISSTNGVGQSSRLEPHPYVRSTYQRRNRRSRSGSQNRILEEPRSGEPQINGGEDESSCATSTRRDGLKLEGTMLPVRVSHSNANLSSRPPRYSSRHHVGSQGQLQSVENGGRQINSLHSGLSIGDSISSAVGHALTQPVRVSPEERETGVRIGWSERGNTKEESSRSTRKVVDTAKERESEKDGRSVVQRAISLSPPAMVVESETKLNGLPAGGVAVSIATGSTHPTNDTSSESTLANKAITAMNNQEEVPIVWEVIKQLD